MTLNPCKLSVCFFVFSFKPNVSVERFRDNCKSIYLFARCLLVYSALSTSNALRPSRTKVAFCLANQLRKRNRGLTRVPFPALAACCMFSRASNYSYAFPSSFHSLCSLLAASGVISSLRTLISNCDSL